MKPENIRRQVEAARSIPLPVRLAILARPEAVRPGAIPALARFFTALKRLKAPPAVVAAAAFRQAAATESTLATLLGALETFAPEVCLAEGRDLRRAFYRKRSGGGDRRRGPAPLSATAPAAWPAAWQAGYAALVADCRKESVARSFVARLDRCAEELARLDLPPDLTMILLGRNLRHKRGRKRGEPFAPRSVANHIDACLALAKALGAPEATRVGIRDIATVWRNRAKRRTKEKIHRIDTWIEEGNSYGALIAGTMAAIEEAASAGSSWRATAARQRRGIAVLIMGLNTVARTGDQSRWRIGHELERHADGSWSLDWRQGKTGEATSFGKLWPETARALDLHLLGGRSETELALRYAALGGANWITLEPQGPSTRYASTIVKEMAGLPGHDLRTLASDLLRLIDPKKGAARASALMMHRDPRSQKAYAAAARGLGAARDWGDERTRLRRSKRGSGRGAEPEAQPSP
ncbi:MAG: hypothetical protein MUC67_03500 [Acidobacteria bacterium]|jgi:hypothetical protein|nr:hypothetical protein [Acidobacteriota bacterium]